MISSGFGNVKAALTAGGKAYTIDPDTRFENMRGRLAGLAKNLDEAIREGDLFGISYFWAAYAQQRMVMDQLLGYHVAQLSPDAELTERDRIPEALPEVERLPEPGNDADDADDVAAPDAKPLAGQEPG